MTKLFGILLFFQAASIKIIASTLNVNRLYENCHNGAVSQVRAAADQYGRDAVCAVLPYFGVDLEWTCLHIAVARGKESVVSLLLSLPCPVNPRDKYNGTPLRWAIQDKRTTTIMLLLAKGASLPMAGLGTYQQSLFDSSMRSDEVKKAIEETLNVNRLYQNCHNGAVSQVRAAADQYGRYAVCAVLPYLGVDLEWTCLHVAAARGEESVVSLVLSLPCPVDPTDKYNRTPLRLAIENKSTTTIMLLLTKGASLQMAGQGTYHQSLFDSSMRSDEVRKAIEQGLNH